MMLGLMKLMYMYTLVFSVDYCSLLQVVVWVDPLDGTKEFTNGKVYRFRYHIGRPVPMLHSPCSYFHGMEPGNGARGTPPTQAINVI